jgi:hypothetical protein
VASSLDTLHNQVEAADTLVAFAEADIGSALAAADRLMPLAEAHIVRALVLAAGRLAGLVPLRPPERVARHPQLARWLRTFCRIFGPEGTLCHKKDKTL